MYIYTNENDYGIIFIEGHFLIISTTYSFWYLVDEI